MSSFTSLIMTLKEVGVPFEYIRNPNIIYYPCKDDCEYEIYKPLTKDGEYLVFPREGKSRLVDLPEMVGILMRAWDGKNLLNALMTESKAPDPFDIDRVIFSPPATIVKWSDGTKTVVKADEEFDKEKGLAMCIAKKAFGNKGNYYDVFKYFIKD